MIRGGLRPAENALWAGHPGPGAAGDPGRTPPVHLGRDALGPPASG